jgi:hypothetical protein
MLLALEFEAHQHPRPVIASRRRLEDPPKADPLEHADRSNVRGRAVDPRAARVDRICLERGRMAIARERDQPLKGRSCDAAPAKADPHGEAVDRPNRHVIDQWDRSRPDESADARPGPNPHQPTGSPSKYASMPPGGDSASCERNALRRSSSDERS